MCKSTTSFIYFYCTSTVICHILTCISKKCFLKIKAVYSLLILMCNLFLFFYFFFKFTPALNLTTGRNNFHISFLLETERYTLKTHHSFVSFFRIILKLFCDDKHSFGEVISLINSLSFTNNIIITLLILLLLLLKD